MSNEPEMCEKMKKWFEEFSNAHYGPFEGISSDYATLIAALNFDEGLTFDAVEMPSGSLGQAARVIPQGKKRAVLEPTPVAVDAKGACPKKKPKSVKSMIKKLRSSRRQFEEDQEKPFPSRDEPPSTPIMDEAKAAQAKTPKVDKYNMKNLEDMFLGMGMDKESSFESFLQRYKAMQVPQAKSQVPRNVQLGFSGSVQKHLLPHLATDKNEQRNQCPNCIDEFTSKFSLSEHKCPKLCPETKQPTADLYPCPICQLKLQTKRNFVAHLKNVHDLVALPSFCLKCNYRCSPEELYGSKINPDYVQCPFCMDVFTLSPIDTEYLHHVQTFYEHLREHTIRRDRKFRCEKCEQAMAQKCARGQQSSKQHSNTLRNSKALRKIIKKSKALKQPATLCDPSIKAPPSATPKMLDNIAAPTQRLKSEYLSQDLSNLSVAGPNAGYLTMPPFAAFQEVRAIAASAPSPPPVVN